MIDKRIFSIKDFVGINHHRRGMTTQSKRIVNAGADDRYSFVLRCKLQGKMIGPLQTMPRTE